MAEYNIKELKTGGFMKQKEKDLFSVRLRCAGGYVRSDQLPKLAEIADKYGRGHIHLTTRQGIEIPYVHFNNFDKVKKELSKVGLEVGACGPRVRTVTACQGDICSLGLIDAQEIGKKFDQKFFGKGGLPHKFKIGITGCPNACIKPLENDFGVMGKIEKNFNEKLCNYCGLCAEVCPVKAITVKGEKLLYDEAKCIGCAECVLVCPTEAWEKKKEGYAVYVGGKMGKFPALGQEVFDFVPSEDKLFEIVEKTLEFYRKEGKKGERFRETLDRVGIDYFKEKIK